ncbi:MAG: sulfotransferase [Dolichospermum sp. BR01]|jgi:hypothetical protein|nr:sulfotransferase [Dolichospermum sp. BR01]
MKDQEVQKQRQNNDDLILGLSSLKNWMDLSMNVGKTILPKVLRHWLWVNIGVKLYYRALKKTIHLQEYYAEPLNIIQGIDCIKLRFPELNTQEIQEITEKPIFVFSAGMRSGSTWIQRLMMSSPETLIWGEPYAGSSIIQNMAKQIEQFSLEFPRKDCIYNQEIEDISNQWVANLYPDLKFFQQAHRLFFINLFAIPARQKGAKRWGLKEVRLTGDHAVYLQWLFPESKFIFLVRNPYHAYQSYKVFTYFSEQQMTTENFGYIWKNLSESYVMYHEKINAEFLKYEDVVKGNFDLQELGSYLEIDLIDPNQLTRISNKHYLPQIDENTKITTSEINILKNIVNPLAEKLGYYPEN